MKNKRKNILYLISAITLFANTTYSQTAKPIGMEYVGSQQYIGQTTQIKPKIQQQAPTINSIYSQPMKRVNEIPLYGKNKSTYFYSQPKQQTGIFSDGNLYMFGTFATGKTTDGINLQDKSVLDYIGSDAHDNMGNPTGLGFGFGRAISSTFNVEIFYSKYTGMNYGPFTAQAYEEEFCEDEECTSTYWETSILNDYENIRGGDISSDFFGVGFQYNLNNIFGSVFGSNIKPYVGFQLGFAMNNIDDYTLADTYGLVDGNLMFVEDEEGNQIANPDLSGVCTASKPCYQSDYTDGEVTYIGKNNKTFGYGLEAGLTLTLEGNMELDFFFKRNMLGKATTSGNVLSSYYVSETEFIESTDTIGSDCASQGYTWNGAWCVYEGGSYLSETMEQRLTESGDVVMNVFGVKLKYIF